MLAEITEVYDASAALCYSADALNRCGAKRKDVEWVNSLKASSDARFLIQANDSFVCNQKQVNEPFLHSKQMLERLNIADALTIFLGVDEAMGTAHILASATRQPQKP